TKDLEPTYPLIIFSVEALLGFFIRLFSIKVKDFASKSIVQNQFQSFT
ncbi:MAG: hypothetical protein ACI96G_000046, partial [Flavobacterium sp.]